MERERSKTFQDLIVWQKAHAFVLSVYSFSRAFPKEELYGRPSLLRRAAVSIPANIAEGFKKAGKPDKCRFMKIKNSRFRPDIAPAMNCRYLPFVPDFCPLRSALCALPFASCLLL